MSENLKMEDLVEQVDSTSETTEQVETTEVVETTPEVTTEQDPLKIELEKVQNKGGRTELEKAQYSLKKNAERLKELGGDPTLVLGIEPKEDDEEENEDDKPVTLGMLKKMQNVNATKTAMQLAEEIPDNTEKELVKYYLENRIQPSGNPQEDLKDARRMVNAVKNEQIVQEISRKTPAQTHSNSSGVDAKQEQAIVYTQEELQMMRPPFNVTPAEILASRAGKNFSFKK